MTKFGDILKTAALAGALALASQPAFAFGGHGFGGVHGFGGFHGGPGGWHGGPGGWHSGPGWHGGPGWRRGWGWGAPFVGFGIGAPLYYDDYYYGDYSGPACTLRRVLVETPYGLRARTVRYCY